MKSTLIPLLPNGNNHHHHHKSSINYHHSTSFLCNLKKMFTRRNWLLRCSILINVAVILYICSHVMIGGGNNFNTGPAYVIQQQQQPQQSQAVELSSSDGSGSVSVPNNLNNNSNKLRQIILTNSNSNNLNNNNNNNKLNEYNSQNSNQQINNIIGSASQVKAIVTSAVASQVKAFVTSAVASLQQQQQSVNKQQEQDLEKQPIPEEILDDDPSIQNNKLDQSAGTGDDPQKESVIQVIPQAHGNHNLNIINNNPSSNLNNVVPAAAAAVGVDDEKDVPIDLNEIAAQEKSQNEIAGQSDPVVNLLNNTNTDNYIANGDEKDFDERLRSLLKCHERDYVPEILQRGDFWVLKNYIRAEHGPLKCHETITYTTHADYTFLDNLIPLLERWGAPVSIALHAPGTDFQQTLNSIKYLRDCLPESNLVRQFVTFHIYFSTKHIPKQIPKAAGLLDPSVNPSYNCTLPPPFINVSIAHLYKTQKKLLYPVNVGRNIARDSAQTHFILASDIELYPNPGLVKKFLEMIARNDAYLQRKSPRVFPLSIFEVESSMPVPKDKTELQDLLRIGKAIPFHKRVCSSCHGVPKSKEWMVANETEELGVFHIGKRVGYFVHWEPIYIGSHSDPHYDERLSWEGKSDKMTQGYALCALDYEFHILDNAFLVHKPGIKVLKKDPRRAMLAAKTNQLIKKIIYPELRIMYGIRKGCAV